jgi:hypothetical protein
MSVCMFLSSETQILIKCFWHCSFVNIRVSDIYFYFQTKTDAIHLLQHIDSKLGVPLAERSYGGNCRIYDQDVPEDPFHNIYVSHVLFGVCGLLLLKRYNLFKVLACSTTFFHLSLSCATFFQLRTFILFISSKTSSSHHNLGLPIGLLYVGFHLLIFFALLSSAMRST